MHFTELTSYFFPSRLHFLPCLWWWWRNCNLWNLRKVVRTRYVTQFDHLFAFIFMHLDTFPNQLYFQLQSVKRRWRVPAIRTPLHVSLLTTLFLSSPLLSVDFLVLIGPKFSRGLSLWQLWRWDGTSIGCTRFSSDKRLTLDLKWEVHRARVWVLSSTSAY